MDAARKGAAARGAAAARKAAAVDEAREEAAARGPPQLPLVDSQEAGATNLRVRRRPPGEWAEGSRPRTPVALPQAVEAGRARKGCAARLPEEWQAPRSRRPRTAAILRRRATEQTGIRSPQLKSGSKLPRG